jgi:hypothetical protein
LWQIVNGHFRSTLFFALVLLGIGLSWLDIQKERQADSLLSSKSLFFIIPIARVAGNRSSFFPIYPSQIS